MTLEQLVIAVVGGAIGMVIGLILLGVGFAIKDKFWP